MLKRILITLVLCLPALPSLARAQTSYETSVAGSGYEDMAVGESRDVPCPYGLAATVDGHFGVPFGGKNFLTDWQSDSSNFPLPSRNWYHAVPNGDPISTDGRARWEDAKIQVHCWIYRAFYVLQRHYDVVAGSGRLVEICEDRERVDIESTYDEGGTVPNSATLSTCSGDGGGGGGGGGTVLRCYTVTTEHYWYYPDTGQIEYRYTEVHTYCEQSST